MSATVDFPVKAEAREYLARFARDPNEPCWLAARRQQALTRFAEIGFPSRRSEAWRYLDLGPLLRAPLPPAPAGSPAEMPPGPSLDAAGARLTLRNGDCTSLTPRALPQGVWFRPMRQAIADRPDLLRAAALGEGSAEQPFAALNLAFFTDGFVLDVAPGVVLDRPLEVVHFGSASDSLHTRSLINLGAGSRAAIVETYAGNGRYWRNDVLAVRLAAGAELSRTVLVEEAAAAVHLGQLEASLARDAALSGFALLLGGSRVRQEWNVRLVGEGARCRLDGAFLVAGNDEANIVTAVDHAAPGSETRELVKGVAAEHGHGAFQGRIAVRPEAQRTDARQLSRNLLIGRRAVIDTKPELEILADDVKCSHGASVGDLDAAALFYLQARGIPPAEARRMLIEGFLREPVEAIADRALREHLLCRLALRLGRLGTLEG